MTPASNMPSVPVRNVTIELDPSWADELMDCYRCGYPIIDWDDVVAVPAGAYDSDPPTMAALIHRECPMRGIIVRGES